MKFSVGIIISSFLVFYGITAFGEEQVIENDAIKISFDKATNGFGILGIVNKLVGDTSFALPGKGSAGWPTLWNIIFQRKKADGGYERRALKNVGFSAQVNSSLMKLPELQKLVMTWKGLSLSGAPKSIDVCVTVTLYAGEAPSNWTIKVTNRSKNWSTSNVQFPFICNVAEKGTADVLWPKLPIGGKIYKKNTRALKGNYPSWYCPMQFTAFNKGKAGLYIAAHDGNAGIKTLNLTSKQHFSFDIPAENSTVAGNNWSPDYPIVIAAYKGDWWQAARLYKGWANAQKWCSKGPLAKRKNIPKGYYDVDFWLHGNMKLDQWATPRNLEMAAEQAKKFFAPAKVGVYINGQQVYKFDTHYPDYFPVMPGVSDSIEKLVAKKFIVMPYINAYLWDTGLSSFAETGRKGAILKVDKTIDQSPTPAGEIAAYMCPYSEIWQKKIASICKRLSVDLKVNAIYLDQLACTTPKQCFNPEHGHPLGGGHYWVDGYREMLKQIRKKLAGRNVAITSEGCSDAYIDLIDGFLIGHSYRDSSDVPLFQAVYSGYTTFYGILESRMDDIDAFAAYHGSGFLLGIQLGWLMRFNVDGLKDKSVDADVLYNVDAFNGANTKFKAIANLLKYLSQYRHATSEFLTYGCLIDEVKFTKDVGTVEIDRHRYFSKKGSIPAKVTFPAVGSAVWLNANKDAMAIFLMNYSDTPKSITFEQDIKCWLKTKSYTCSRVTLNGTSEIAVKNSKNFSKKLSLNAREVAVFVIRKK